MSEALIRVRESSDLPAVGRLLEKVYQTDGYPVEGVSDPIKWLTPPDLLCAWIASVDGIVGHAFVTEPHTGHGVVDAWIDQGGEISQLVILGRLFVDSSIRGQNLGVKLTKLATAWAESHGKRLALIVLDKDQAAIRLYDKLGWKCIGTSMYKNAQGVEYKSYCYVSPSPPAD